MNLLLTLIAVLPMQSADTTVAVTDGMRLDLRNPYGEIRVSTWNRNEVRLSTESSQDAQFEIERSGSVIRVRMVRLEPRGRGRSPRAVRIRGDDQLIKVMVTVPEYLDVQLQGVDTDIFVNDVGGDVTAETVEGTIEVVGGNGFISVENQEEPIRVTGARGRVEVAAGDGDVFIRDVTGELTVEAVDGNIDLRGIAATSCEANTVDGNVVYQGTIADNGRYAFTTHDGDVTLLLPSGANATVSVTNYDGVFETAFPVVLRGSSNKVFQFVLGSGQASVELAAFHGDIFLRRADRR
jgi:DUF4097 and DUF4098 domain-containing protein YvlB